MNIGAITVAGSKVLAGTTDGVFCSADGGLTWTRECKGLPQCCVRSFAMTADGDVLLGTAGKGVFRTLEPAISMK
jgi:hypothetical protein